MKRKIRRLVLVIAAFVLVAVISEEVEIRLQRPGVRSQGPNGMWLRHSWVGEKHTKSEYESLAAKLRAMHITDAYFHAGPFRADGSIDPKRIRYAADLLRNMRHFAPETHLYAWLGQVEAKAGGPLDLSKAETRAAVIRTSIRFLDMGFDGIHLDIEPIYSDDRGFIGLLAATHEETGRRHRLLSVGACKPEPISGMENAARRFSKFPGYWTRPYFRQAAEECDQIAIMAYDTAIPLPSVYVGLVSWITRWSAEQTSTTILIGVPTYDDVTGSHYPYVENLDNALVGLKRGLSGLPESTRCKVGASIYAEWTTSDAEAKAFRSEWLGIKEPED